MGKMRVRSCEMPCLVLDDFLPHRCGLETEEKG